MNRVSLAAALLFRGLLADGPDDAHHSTRIEDAIALRSGIVTEEAGPGFLEESAICYGRLALGPARHSHVRARYPGLILRVEGNIGDRVSRGDLLVVVESNASLQEYRILAPIGGTIIARDANTGEFAGEQALLSIADMDTLWAHLRVYPAQQARVEEGMAVRLRSGGREFTATIANLVPQLGGPWLLARLSFDNRTLGLAPGLLAEGEVQVARHPVALLVRSEGLQTMEGERGVFVKRGTEYIFAPLELGRDDGRRVEVISGLEEGDVYVTTKSFLIRADIEKSHAEHEH